jgi:hypothetical protein
MCAKRARGIACWRAVPEHGVLDKQVKKIIARMRAKAVMTKLEDSIKHDESYVSSVEKKAEKADRQ